VQVLRSLGLHPNLLACRSSDALENNVRDKLALFCQVPPDNVLGMHDVSNIWQVPCMMMAQKAHVTVCNCLGLTGYSSINLDTWTNKLANKWDSLTETVTIAVIGKYTDLSDAYLSVIKALQHACLAMRRKLVLQWVEAGDLEVEVCTIIIFLPK
jgi:CTP synthase